MSTPDAIASPPPLPPPPAPTHAPSFLPPTTRATWTVGLLVAGMGLQLAGLGFDGATLAIVRAAQRGQPTPKETGELIDLGNGLVSLANFAVYIATAVLFCCWLYRVVKNAHQITEAKGPTPALAAGSFFIPLYCLWGPFVAVKFAWSASGGLARGERAPGMTLLAIWWTTWVLGNLVGQIVLRQTVASWGQQPTLEQLALETTANIVLGVLNIICAGLCIAIVRTLTRMQVEIDLQTLAHMESSS